MARYIDAVQCAETLSQRLDISLQSLVEAFVEIPTADVAEVKRGKWILDESVRLRFGERSGDEDYKHYCSCCNEEALYSCGDDSGPWWYLSDYCPNCGANMEKA